MPQPIVLQYGEELSRGIEQAGGAIAGALGERTERNRELELRKQGGTILNEVLGKLPANATTQQYQQAISELYARGVSPDLIKQTIELYKPVIKQREEMSSFNEMFGGGQTAQQGTSPASIAFGAEGPLATAMQQSPKDSPISIIKSGMATKQPMETMFNMGDVRNLGDSELLRLASMPNPIANKVAKTEIEMRKLNQQKFNDERNFNAKGAEEAEKKVSALRESIPKKRQAFEMARQAIASGEVGAFSINNFAERLGIPELQTAKGAQLLTASKEFLLGNMARVSAKGQNQWFEQRLAAMFPQIGKSRAANETITEMLQADLALDEAYVTEYNKLAKQDQEQYGYIKKNIEQRAYENIAPIEKKIMDKTNYMVQKIYETEKGDKWVMENAKRKPAKGTMLTAKMYKAMLRDYGNDPVQTIQNAKKLGYKIPTGNEMREYEQL